MRTLDRGDLDATVELAEHDLRQWRGSRVLVTGATGFVGTWTTAVLTHANTRLGLDLDLVVLARRPEKLSTHIETPGSVTSFAGDVRTLDIDRIGQVDAIIHLACPSGAAPGSADHDPANLSQTIVEGGRAMLRLAAKNKARLFLASSGAVHGRGGDRPARVPEECAAIPRIDDPSAVYGISKGQTETDAIAATEANEVDAVIGRLWAFVGPLLPLDAHYAAGNFVADAIAGREIVVKGDPATVRTYLYPVDLVVWLLAVLTRGQSATSYNIGSDVETTIGELAATVAKIAGNVAGVRLAGAGPARSGFVDRYVPDTTRARSELGVRQTVALDDAIERTLRWHRAGVTTLMGTR